MKKITFFLTMFFCFALWNVNAQFTFPTIAGPTNVAAGSPVTLNLNDAGNSASVPAGLYDSFSITVDWSNPAGNPWSSEAELQVITSNGQAADVDPPSSGGLASGADTTLTFEGDIIGNYDPGVDGLLEIVLGQSYDGSSADWSNIEVTLFEAPTCLNPINLGVDVTTATTADLSWDPGSTETSFDIEIVDVTGGGSATGTPTDAGITSPYSAMSLTEGNDYEFYVRADCGGGDLSEWVGPFSWLQVEAPDNDLCDNATVLECGTPLNAQTTLGASGGSATSCVGSIGDDIWYVFNGNDSDVDLNLNASVEEGQIGVYESTDGTCGGFTSGTCIASGGSGGNPVTVSFAANAGTTYYIRIGNWINGDPAIEFDLEAVCTPFPTCLEPSDLSVSVITTTTADLSWTANSGETMWDVEVVDVTGGGSATGTPTDTDVSNPYTAMGLTEGNDYEFYVRANCGGGDLSEWAGPFSWSQNLPPSNDECDNAISLTVNEDELCSSVTSGTTVAATASSQADDVTGTPNNDVWFSFEATNESHIVELQNITAVVGTSTDMGMGVYDGSAGCMSLVFVDDSDPNSFTVSGLTIGTTYLLRVYGWSSSSTATAQTNFDVCVGTPPPPPANDDFANAEPVACDGNYTGSTELATLDEDDAPDNSAADLDAPNVWYSYTGSGTAEDITLDLCPSDYDSSVLVYTGTSGNLTLVAANDDGGEGNCGDGNGTRSFLTFQSDGTTTYYITIEGWNVGSTGNYDMTVSCVEQVPAPDNDLCANAEELTVAIPAPGTTVGATVEVADDNPSCESTFATIVDVWYSFVATEVNMTVLTTVGTADQANVAVYEDCTLANQIGCSDANGGETLDLTGLTIGNSYIVRVWNDGVAAPSTSGRVEGDFTIVVDATLSNGNFEDEAAFTYYPNPVKNTLTLNAQNTIENVVMYNMLGQEVLRATPNNVDSDLDMSQLQNGTYFVKVTIANVTETIRVIKE